MRFADSATYSLYGGISLDNSTKKSKSYSGGNLVHLGFLLFSLLGLAYHLEFLVQDYLTPCWLLIMGFDYIFRYSTYSITKQS